jgi:hypothetical protein
MSPHSTLKPGFPAKCLWPLFLEAQGWARCQIVHPVNGHDAKDPVIYVENGSIIPHGGSPVAVDLLSWDAPTCGTLDRLADVSIV